MGLSERNESRAFGVSFLENKKAVPTYVEFDQESAFKSIIGPGWEPSPPATGKPAAKEKENACYHQSYV